MALFDDERFDIPCSDCGKKHSKTIAWLKSHKEIACPCGTTIVVDSREVHDAIRRIEQSLKGMFK